MEKLQRRTRHVLWRMFIFVILFGAFTGVYVYGYGVGYDTGNLHAVDSFDINGDGVLDYSDWGAFLTRLESQESFGK
jgi:hypothetical protein